MVVRAPVESATSRGGTDRRRWALRAALVLATALWMVAWGRLGAVGVSQPGPWHRSTWIIPGGEAGTNTRFRCGGNAFQRGEIVYRTNCFQRDADDDSVYVVAFDLARRTATVRWALPEAFVLADYYLAVASEPGGGLTLMASEGQRIARLHADGLVEDLGDGVHTPMTLYGFGWRDGKLDVLYQPRATHESLELVTYAPGGGWSQPRVLPKPPCAADQACIPLNASRVPGGWEVRYGRAPLRPADPRRVTAEVVAVDPAGTARTVQSLALERDPAKPSSETDAYTITPDGTLRWFYYLADRGGGNVLNISGRPLFRQDADGLLEPVATPPPGLLPGRGPTADGPRLASLDASYLLSDSGLVWQPIFTRSGNSFDEDRVVLFGDRWLALRATEQGITLEGRGADAAATPGEQPVLVLGKQAELASLDAYLTPLLQAPDGTYWLVGWRGLALHMDADLHRLDERNALDRLRLLFAGFFGFYEGDFHDSWGWLKAGGTGLILLGWPLALLGLALGRRLGRPSGEVWRAWLLRAAVACIALDLLFARWFWTASGYF